MCFRKKKQYFSLFFSKNSCNQQIFCIFAGEMQMSINLHGQLLDLSLPKVMAIVNVSPDSFYTSWGQEGEQVLLDHVQTALRDGADILDIGACSTRPGSAPVSSAVEWQRLEPALQAIRYHFPLAVLSVDTFRSEIAERAIAIGADLINDVSGGDEAMWRVVAEHRVPYVLTHASELPQKTTSYDATMSEVLGFLQARLDMLHRMGVADVVIDPGFGFGKTQQQNYALLNQMDVLATLHAPILVGISRKSMLYKPLDATPMDVLPATIAANTIALQRGANILRVHDVAAAKQTIEITRLTQNT